MGIKVPSFRDVGNTLSRPAQQVGEAIGIRNVSISTPLGRNSTISNIGSDINQTWINAGNGEIGKFVSSLAQSLYDLGLAAPRAVITGQYGKEFQRATGSAANIATGGTAGYLGSSIGAQKFLRDTKLSKYTLGVSENFAGTTRGISTMSRDGYLNNDDRNNIFQGAVKYGAVAAGVGIYGYLSAPATTGAVEVTAIPGYGAAPGIASSPIYSAPIAPGAMGAAESGVPLSSGFWSGAWETTKAGAAGVGKTIGSVALARAMGSPGGVSIGTGGIIPGQDGGNFIDDIFSGISSLFGGGGGGGSTVAAPQASNSNPVMASVPNLMVLGGVGLGAYLLFKRLK